MNYTEYLRCVYKAADFDALETFTAEIVCPENAYEIIYAVGHNDFERLISLSGLSMRQFGLRYGISYTTIQGWKYRKRAAPEYVIQLLGYTIMVSSECKQMLI